MADRLFVAGAGSWGTALAVLLEQAGREVTLWCRSPDQAGAMAESRANARYLPGVPLPENLDVTSDLEAVRDAAGCLFVVPAQSARTWLGAMRDAAGEAGLPVALCCKGLERGSMAPMHRVLSEAWIDESFVPRTRSPWSGLGYGYGWFLGQSGGQTYALARGYGGQVVAVAPNAGITVVITSDPTRPARSGGYFGDLQRLIEQDILAPLV